MKRKFLSAVVITGALFLTACQEDETMDELIQDINTGELVQANEGPDQPNTGGSSGDDKPG